MMLHVFTRIVGLSSYKMNRSISTNKRFKLLLFFQCYYFLYLIIAVHAHKSCHTRIISNNIIRLENESDNRERTLAQILIRNVKKQSLLLTLKQKCTTSTLVVSELQGFFNLRGGGDEENDSIQTESINMNSMDPTSTISIDTNSNSSPVSVEANIPASTSIQNAIDPNSVNIASDKSIIEKKNARLNDLKQRTIVACILIIGLLTIITQFRETGVAILLFIISIGLYYEATDVAVKPRNSAFIESNSKIRTSIGGTDKSSNTKWIWFIAYSLSGTIPPILLLLLNENRYASLKPICNLLSYCLVIGGFVELIVRLNSTAKNSETSLIDFKKAWNEVGYYHTSILMTVIPISFWIYLLQMPFGLEWGLYTSFLIIINDTAAYLFGSTIGKTSFIPQISPKKTLEGYIGALLSTIILSVPLWKLVIIVLDGTSKSVITKSTIHPIHYWIVAFYCSVVGPVGGFLASSIKRTYGKKDYGAIFLNSGHGGLIDRLDCHLFVIPFVYLYLQATNGKLSVSR